MHQMHWAKKHSINEMVVMIKQGKVNGIYRSNADALELAKNFNTGFFGFLCRSNNDNTALKKEIGLFIEIFIAGISI